MGESRSMDSAALQASAAALARATAFLEAGRGGPFRARSMANGLRELDRFLSVLIDEVADNVLRGGMDGMVLARQRNTPNKLRSLRAALGLDSPDHERLRTIGRSRERLFHSTPPRGGVDSRRVPEWLLAAGLEQRHAAEAETLAVEMRRICRLYDRLRAELLEPGCQQPFRHRATLTFAGSRPISTRLTSPATEFHASAFWPHARSFLFTLLAPPGRCLAENIFRERKYPMPIGNVKFFNGDKGYGFIANEDGSGDAFVHISAVERAGMSTLNKDQRISYELETDRRGKQSAVNLQSA
jgi:CspA family cold shock protein